jgi:hypothetical protein
LTKEKGQNYDSKELGRSKIMLQVEVSLLALGLLVLSLLLRRCPLPEGSD